jgi:hypothetical protein
MSNAKLGRASGNSSWDTDIVCVQSGNAVSYMFPMQPSPLGSEVPSGLSRAAQLSVLQTVSVPALPAYCVEQGGVVCFMFFFCVYSSATSPHYEYGWLRLLVAHAVVKYGNGTARSRRHHCDALQVLDRVVFHRGSKNSWRSAVLRVRAQSLRDTRRWQTAPLGLFGLSLRARAGLPSRRSQISIPATRPPVTFNACMDIESLSLSGEALDSSTPSSSQSTSDDGPLQPLSKRLRVSNIPPTSVTIRKDLDGGRVLQLVGHLNRPFGHVAGWEKVRCCDGLRCIIGFVRPQTRRKQRISFLTTARVGLLPINDWFLSVGTSAPPT